MDQSENILVGEVEARVIYPVRIEGFIAQVEAGSDAPGWRCARGRH